MLVLTRRLGERILVEVNGETVSVEIMKIGGSRVSVGVSASKNVAIRRQELTPRVRMNGAPSNPVCLLPTSARRSVAAMKPFSVR